MTDFLENDIYTEEGIKNLLEQDAISNEEFMFMTGYLAA